LDKLNRNDYCWCGSGKKYKKCHLEFDLEAERLRLQGLPVPKRSLLKTESQIEGIHKACQLSRQILDLVTDLIKPGITTNELDQWVHNYTVEHGAYPAPLNYRGFPKSICTSINDVVVHGIPDDTVLKDGDIINVDVTCILNGYYGDMSRMYLVGNPTQEARQLVDVARQCLYLGIEQVKPFNRLGDIAFAIESHAQKFGYSVVREFGGHGIGKNFHEDPFVYHYGQKESGMILLPNMVFTIEPMINSGSYKCKILKDGWTAVTVDHSLSAQWEHTVRVTQDGVEILTE